MNGSMSSEDADAAAGAAAARQNALACQVQLALPGLHSYLTFVIFSTLPYF